MDDFQEKDDFQEIEAKIFTDSITYRNSVAFQRALNYIAKHDLALYHELICQEYDEAFGDD